MNAKHRRMVDDAKAAAREKRRADHPPRQSSSHHLWGDYITREKDPAQEDERRTEIAKAHSLRYPDDAHRFRAYGLSVPDFNRLLAQQNGVCAICREPEREERSLSVDHDHRTGRVRSLLCSGCNKAIGFLRESPLLARAAATYLEQQLTKEFTGE
jgi:hypothetical protein